MKLSEPFVRKIHFCMMLTLEFVIPLFPRLMVWITGHTSRSDERSE